MINIATLLVWIAEQAERRQHVASKAFDQVEILVVSYMPTSENYQETHMVNKRFLLIVKHDVVG